MCMTVTLQMGVLKADNVQSCEVGTNKLDAFVSSFSGLAVSVLQLYLQLNVLLVLPVGVDY
jgi:hypothetical protein